MSPDRKLKLRKREEKSARARAERLALLDRLLRVLDLDEIFGRFPQGFRDRSVESMPPRTEVIVAEDSRDDPELKEVAREIQRLIKKPTWVNIEGRDFELAVDDAYRGYSCIGGILRDSADRYCRDPLSRTREAYDLVHEACNAVRAIDHRRLNRIINRVVLQIPDLTTHNFRVDGRMIEIRISRARNSAGHEQRRMELRLHTARPRVVSFLGSQWTAFPCVCSYAPIGLRHISWDCQRLGIGGPSRRLPVYIERHAIRRLHERLPLEGQESRLHRLMVWALENPVVTPQGDDRCLVELRLGEYRVGYFVVQILPHMVLVKTFLFLTMQGTPESALLREKLGLHRAVIENYRLDEFFTLTSSDIAGDPLLSRILKECGCGHLSSLCDPADRFEWLNRFGESFKRTIELREAGDGFTANKIWSKWSA